MLVLGTQRYHHLAFSSSCVPRPSLVPSSTELLEKEPNRVHGPRRIGMMAAKNLLPCVDDLTLNRQRRPGRSNCARDRAMSTERGFVAGGRALARGGRWIPVCGLVSGGSARVCSWVQMDLEPIIRQGPSQYCQSPQSASLPTPCTCLCVDKLGQAR